MALITCPDCESRVSDQADSCVQCGRPIARLDVGGSGQSVSEEEADRPDPRERTDVGRNLIDEGPRGMNQYGYSILTASIVAGLGIGYLAGGIWGFFLFSVILMLGVFFAYS